MHWLSAVNTLFCLFVKTTLENRHWYPMLQMRNTQSLYYTLCSSLHVMELGFKSVSCQSEPAVLSYSCGAGA